MVQLVPATFLHIKIEGYIAIVNQEVAGTTYTNQERVVELNKAIKDVNDLGGPITALEGFATATGITSLLSDVRITDVTANDVVVADLVDADFYAAAEVFTEVGGILDKLQEVVIANEVTSTYTLTPDQQTLLDGGWGIEVHSNTVATVYLSPYGYNDSNASKGNWTYGNFREFVVDFEVTGDNPKIEIQANGSKIDAGTVTYSNASFSEFEVTFPSNPEVVGIIMTDGSGTLGDITIMEEFAGIMTEDVSYFKIKLESGTGGYFTNNLDSTISVSGTGGLIGQRDIGFEIIKPDSSYTTEFVIKVLAKDLPTLSMLSGIQISGLRLETGSGDLRVGDVNVTVTPVVEPNTGVDRYVMRNWVAVDGADGTTGVLGKVVEHDVAVTIEESISLIAGQYGDTVRVEFEDLAEGTLNYKQDIFLTIENGIFDYTPEELEGVRIGGKYPLSYTNTDQDRIRIDLGILVDEGDGWTVGEIAAKLKNIDFDLQVSSLASHSGDIVLTASSTNFAEDKQVTLGTVKQPITIEHDGFVVDLGLREQMTGEITLTETEAGMLLKDHTIVVDLEILSVLNATVEAEGIDVSYKIVDGALEIKVINESYDGAGVIRITDLLIDVPSSQPRGMYDLIIGGDAISFQNFVGQDDQDRFEDVIIVEDFLTVGDDGSTGSTSQGDPIRIEINLSTGDTLSSAMGVTLQLIGRFPG